MSQLSWPQPGENENSQRSAPRENREKSRYEGFEGMNYEQRRQPFHPRLANNNGQPPTQGDEGNRPNEA